MPKISVIVPVYNVEPYLTECIDSILAQTYRDFELILVDDGSTDGCHAICDAYGEKHDFVKVIHQSNMGLSAARNAGIDVSKGEYLTFVDSDDVVTAEFLEVLLFSAGKTGADISCCAMETMTEKGYYKRDADVVLNRKIECESGRMACAHIYKGHNMATVSACSKLFKKDMFDDVRFPNGMIHEDQAVIPIVMYRADKVVYNNIKAYLYRERRSSITHEPFSSKRYDDMINIEKCIEFYKSKGDKELADIATNHEKKLIATYSIKARTERVNKNDIPPQYRMTERAALTTLRRILPDDTYTWYLAQLHPRWLRPHAYLRKIKKMLGIRCN